ncbi:hypothetical protein BS50DRAFT_680521 [Corynespora cassiicola Philippines]|uniref:Uncharacterized protein n=1 Tax=Corynespora cassiicola Philippines TaxID=1448308 RepID=A0A2T2NA21_CORCC|nr:hypothetical protein BS50DRAFT_680521 [Corynespora cassiicola Philippines]
MFNFIRQALGPRRLSATQSISSQATLGEFSVIVGKGSEEKTITIPNAARKACSFIREVLVNGAKIPNADPVIFQTIMDSLDPGSLFDKMRASTPNPLERLLSGSGNDQLLNFVKGWHIAHGLGLIDLQNRIVDMYRELYQQYLHDRLYIVPTPEVFEYLHDRVGHHSPAEKFLIDFYGGLYRYCDPSAVKELLPLPDEIAQPIIERWESTAQLGASADRIVRNSLRFKMDKSDRIVRHGTLAVVPPTESRSASPAIQPAESVQSKRTRTMSEPILTSLLSKSPSSRKNRVRISVPGIESVNGQREVLVEPTLVPKLMKSTGAESIKPP